MTSAAITHPQGISHVRLTVTDIGRSKQFYMQLFGADPSFDFSDKVDEPGVRDDPAQLYGGCGFAMGDQLLGLRPVGNTGDRFDPTRVGLDHVSLGVGSVDELNAAADRLTAAGIEHGGVTDLGDLGMVILSVQDPDNINLELAAPSPSS